MASAMHIEVDGEEVDPALCTRANGWKTVWEKLNKSLAPHGTGSEAAKATPDFIEDTSCSSKTGVDGAERTKRPPIHEGRLLKNSRMPELPRGHMKIVVRPRGGLCVSEVTRVELSRALAAAAQVAAKEAREDVVCPNGHQKILVISNPRRENAGRYAAVECIDVRGTAYEVSTYEAAPYGTVKGVIRGIPLEDTAMDIQQQVVQDYNPTALQANRIGRSRRWSSRLPERKSQDMSDSFRPFGNAVGKESTRDDKNEDEAGSVEVLQFGPQRSDGSRSMAPTRSADGRRAQPLPIASRVRGGGSGRRGAPAQKMAQSSKPPL
ncbi:hypothetical protein HPB48_000477 [Haemaphysalis longicornis]|uniref:Uncharacterized protein n=1 Tax=Haemaphysalis longicornis TaxID=44386 RepID=A0A9J6GB60_HAELO|nr:hypothetical protein HPB48_000477 [Haemaphysalis longicornis]